MPQYILRTGRWVESCKVHAKRLRGYAIRSTCTSQLRTSVTTYACNLPLILLRVSSFPVLLPKLFFTSSSWHSRPKLDLFRYLTAVKGRDRREAAVEGFSPEVRDGSLNQSRGSSRIDGLIKRNGVESFCWLFCVETAAAVGSKPQQLHWIPAAVKSPQIVQRNLLNHSWNIFFASVHVLTHFAGRHPHLLIEFVTQPVDPKEELNFCTLLAHICVFCWNILKLWNMHWRLWICEEVSSHFSAYV